MELSPSVIEIRQAGACKPVRSEAEPRNEEYPATEKQTAGRKKRRGRPAAFVLDLKTHKRLAAGVTASR